MKKQSIMNRCMNGERKVVKSEPFPIPSLSFSLSTPPDSSPEEETALSYFTKPPSNANPRPQLTEAQMVVANTRSYTIDNRQREGAGDEDEEEKNEGAAPTEESPLMSSTKKRETRHSVVSFKFIEDDESVSAEPILENGEGDPPEIGSSISSFFLNKPEFDDLAMVSKSPTDSEHKCLVDFSAKERGLKDPELVSVANTFIEGVITKAREEAIIKAQTDPMSGANIDLTTDPKLAEMVRQFVTEVLTRAKEEAAQTIGKRDNTGNNNSNNIALIKEKTTLLSHTKSRNSSQRGPWYARAARVLSTVFGKMCPCRTPGEL